MKDRSESVAVAENPLARVTDLARTAGSGEVSSAEDRLGKERFLLALARKRALPPSRQRWLLAAAALAVLAIGIVLIRPRPAISYSVLGSRADGGYVQAAEQGAGAKVHFSEGSELLFEAGARGRIAEVSPRGASVVLESGAVHVDVNHLPSAEWSVQAGPYRIAVLGTIFDVRWSGETLEVRLRRGSIVVHGPVAAGEITLLAGQMLVAHPDGELRVGSIGEAESARAQPAQDIPSPPGSAAIVAPSPVPSASAVAAPVEPRPSWSSRVAAGDYAAVLDAAEARGVESALAEAPLADLVALGDAARYRGRTDLARRALVAQRSRFRGSSAATAAAFLLGRLSEDSLGQSAAAIAYYDQYLAEAPSGAFAAEALGRKMIAAKRASGAAAAAPIATDYLARFPSGAYAASAREILERP
jgi:FecR-like protein